MNASFSNVPSKMMQPNWVRDHPVRFEKSELVDETAAQALPSTDGAGDIEARLGALGYLD